jgi:type IV pilus assembly protein PilC
MNLQCMTSLASGGWLAAELWPEDMDGLMRRLIALASLVIWLTVSFGMIALIHFIFSLPMRRAERARLLLDLIDDALARGQSLQEMILSLAQSRDTSLGLRFHLIAAHIENGLSPAAALEKTKRFLLPQISAMLRAGEQLGDLRKVLPACREILRERPEGVRSAMHYLFLVAVLVAPGTGLVASMLTVFVIPKFKEVGAGMNVQPGPLTGLVFDHSTYIVLLQIAVSLLLVVVVLFYAGGPHFARWFQIRSLPLADWLAWRIPWKRKRLQRTFSAMLAVLLDGGVPEAEAVRLAGDATANEICRGRARRVIAELQSGAKLDDAVRAFDDSGEFHWRLTNATHARGGFLPALRGWHEALDAKAFQQEETAAHTITSGLVILNGLMVALIAIGLFGFLVAILKGVLTAT